MVSASGLTCATQAMGSGASPEDQTDSHTGIGRRARRLYREFYEEQYAKLKEAMPKMRRSQLNDACWAMLQKCPQNPFVQRAEALAQQALKRDWYDAAPEEKNTCARAVRSQSLCSEATHSPRCPDHRSTFAEGRKKQTHKKMFLQRSFADADRIPSSSTRQRLTISSRLPARHATEKTSTPPEW